MYSAAVQLTCYEELYLGAKQKMEEDEFHRPRHNVWVATRVPHLASSSKH